VFYRYRYLFAIFSAPTRFREIVLIFPRPINRVFVVFRSLICRILLDDYAIAPSLSSPAPKSKERACSIDVPSAHYPRARAFLPPLPSDPSFSIEAHHRATADYAGCFTWFAHGIMYFTNVLPPAFLSRAFIATLEI